MYHCFLWFCFIILKIRYNFNETLTSINGMSKFVEKNVSSKKQVFSREGTQKKSVKSSSNHIDNRSETLQMKKLQETINSRAISRHGTSQFPLSLNAPVQKKSNKTGLPDNLKSGTESLSGYSMDDVRVHYNSSKPSQLKAHAFAQGTDIHLASGQEKHLPHEAWHVVQQKQGRVKPTIQMKGGTNINDNEILEREADTMGNKVSQGDFEKQNASLMNKSTAGAVSQRVVQRKLILTGTPAYKTRALTIMNNGLFRYTAVLDAATGEVTLTANNLVGPPTTSQQAMYSHLNTIIAHAQTTTIGLVSGSGNVIIGSYGRAEIDLADLEAFAGNEVSSSQSALLHEVVEQFEKQVQGVAYNVGPNEHSGAHGSGMDAEQEYSGFTRGGTVVISRTMNANGTMDAVFDTTYTNTQGRTVITRAVIVGNNIISTTER